MQAYRYINKEVLFEEMLTHATLLLKLKGGCSMAEIKDQFSNIKAPVVEAFLLQAIERGTINVDKGGTYTLQRLDGVRAH